jgi:hypothetical protein
MKIMMPGRTWRVRVGRLCRNPGIKISLIPPPALLVLLPSMKGGGQGLWRLQAEIQTFLAALRAGLSERPIFTGAVAMGHARRFTGIKSVLAFLLACWMMPSLSKAQTTYQFTTVTDPSGGAIAIDGISGNTLVGSQGLQGFVYNGSSFTLLNVPSATRTEALAVSGSEVVGDYVDRAGIFHGFVYNGSSYQTLDDPLGPYSNSAKGVSGTTVVGTFVAAPPGGGDVHGYIYNGTTFTTIDDPSAPPGQTIVTGISGNTIIGNYTGNGFIYNGSSFTTIDDPLAMGFGTTLTGVSGNLFVGNYTDASQDSNGFIYDGSSFTTLDDPLGMGGTVVTGIDGTTIVGYYFAGSGLGINGFVATPIPEPASFTILCLCGLILLCRRRSQFVKEVESCATFATF